MYLIHGNTKQSDRDTMHCICVMLNVTIIIDWSISYQKVRKQPIRIHIIHVTFRNKAQEMDHLYAF